MTPGHSLTPDRTLAASRASLWRGWTEPELLMQWFCPKRGIWLEIDPIRRLVFTDAFTEGFMPTAEPFMTGVVELEDAGPGRTRMRWSARHGTAEARERHLAMGWEAGWNAATDPLEALARTLP